MFMQLPKVRNKQKQNNLKKKNVFFWHFKPHCQKKQEQDP